MTTQSASGFPGLDRNAPTWKIVESIKQLLTGRMNAGGSVTLAANAASTTLTDFRIGANSCILFMPTTADASAEIGNGTIYVATATLKKGSAVITHANNAQADRTFNYIVIG